MLVAVGMLKILDGRWTVNLNLVESLVVETRPWSLHFVTLLTLNAKLRDATGTVQSYSV